MPEFSPSTFSPVALMSGAAFVGNVLFKYLRQEALLPGEYRRVETLPEYLWATLRQGLAMIKASKLRGFTPNLSVQNNPAGRSQTWILETDGHRIRWSEADTAELFFPVDNAFSRSTAQIISVSFETSNAASS